MRPLPSNLVVSPVVSGEPQKAAVPASESEEAKVAEGAALFVRQLMKGLKNIGIYRHAHERYADFMEPAHAALTAFLDEHGVLPLKVGPYTLEYKNQVVYEDQDKENLTYKFYKDGLRFFLFRQGMPADEVLRFAMLALERPTEDELFREDMITRLWKENLMFLEHIVVEGFGFGDLSEEEVEVEVEKIIGYLRHQLAAAGDDVTRFARLSADDLELELNDLDQVRGGIISGRTATSSDEAKVQEDLLVEGKKRLFAKMVLILFQILELDAKEADYDLLLNSFTQVLDTLLLSEDVAGSVALRERFIALSKNRKLPPKRAQMIQRLSEAFTRQMIEPQRLDAVGQYLKLTRDVDAAAVRGYLTACGDDQIITLVETLSGLERQEARVILIEVLAEIGTKHIDVFGRRLEHNSSQVVKDMLAIIDIINPSNKMNLYAKCLDHPNIMIRLEGLKVLAKSPEEGALRHIEKAMKDTDVQMRLGAYRALAVRTPDRAAALFIKVMQSDAFTNLEPRERRAVATALGETKSEAALSFFDGVFAQKGGLLSRGKTAELKSLAIIGLTALASVAAFKVLAREVQNTKNGKELMQAAHKAALRVKEGIKAQRGSAHG